MLTVKIQIRMHQLKKQQTLLQKMPFKLTAQLIPQFKIFKVAESLLTKLKLTKLFSNNKTN